MLNLDSISQSDNQTISQTTVISLNAGQNNRILYHVTLIRCGQTLLRRKLKQVLQTRWRELHILFGQNHFISNYCTTYKLILTAFLSFFLHREFYFSAGVWFLLSRSGVLSFIVYIWLSSFNLLNGFQISSSAQWMFSFLTSPTQQKRFQFSSKDFLQNVIGLSSLPSPWKI